MDSMGKPSTKGEVVLLISPDLKKKNSSTDAGSCSFSKASEPATNSSPKASKDLGAGYSHLDSLKSNILSPTFISSPSPENPIFTASRPPRPPSETLTKRKSFSRSVFSKPKSRFVEQSYPTPLAVVEESNSSYMTSPYRGPAGTPKPVMTPKTPPGEEDEEDIIHEYILTRQKRWHRLKFWVFLEWVALVSVTGLLIASVTVHKLQHFVIWGLEIWEWCLMVMVIFCGQLFTKWFIIVLVFFIQMNYILKKKVLYFVYGMKRSVQLCIWSGLVLLTWLLLFDRGVQRSPNTSKFLNYVSRTLASIFVGSVLWLLKTLLLKLLAASFHVNAFFDRIQESFFHQYILQTLSGPPLMELAEKIGTAASTRSTGQVSFRSTNTRKGAEEQAVIDVAKLHKMKQEKVSALTMKRLVNTITTSGLWTISSTLDETAYEDGSEQKDKEITSEREAKAAAYQIFKNVAKPDSKYIDVEDLLRFLSEEEMVSVLPQLEGGVETRKVKKSSLRKWVVNVYIERKSLAHSLNDTKTAVRQLNKLASGLLIVIIIVIWLLMMGFATTQVIVLISSQLLLVVFMFGNTCKTIFEAIIFVFVQHPFDVGDRCVIDGVQMIVEEMNILTTTFLRYDNEKIYYPNSVLATKPISNFYRSPDMSDAVEFSVDVSTSMESIGALKQKIKMYIDSKPQHWHTNHSVVVKEIEDMNKMKMALYVLHTMNHHNMGEKTNRRSDLLFEMKKIFEELGIKYHLLPQEVHLTYVTGLPMNIGW